MHYIEIIRNLVVMTLSGEVFKHPETKKPILVGTVKVIEGRLADPKFGQSTEWLFAAYEILRKLREIKDDDTHLALESDHWKKLAEVTDKPSKQAPYNPMVACGLVPIIKKITDATEDKPVVEESKPVVEESTEPTPKGLLGQPLPSQN